MENKKNIKNLIRIGIISMVLLLAGVFLNLLLERPSMKNRYTSQYSSKQTFVSFHKNVIPILDKHCSVCHGVDEEKYKSIKNSSQSKDLLRWQVGISGSIETIEQSQQLYNDLLSDEKDPTKNNLITYDLHPIGSHLLRAGLAKKIFRKHPS